MNPIIVESFADEIKKIAATLAAPITVGATPSMPRIAPMPMPSFPAPNQSAAAALLARRPPPPVTTAAMPSLSRGLTGR